jgi:hypothetical protein
VLPTAPNLTGSDELGMNLECRAPFFELFGKRGMNFREVYFLGTWVNKGEGRDYAQAPAPNSSLLRRVGYANFMRGVLRRGRFPSSTADA